MKQLQQRYIYKLPSKALRNAKWKLELPLPLAMKDYREYIVSLGSSQELRFIDEIRGIYDVEEKALDLKLKIKKEKRKPRGKNTKTTIDYLYKKLYELLFVPDYICIIMTECPIMTEPTKDSRLMESSSSVSLAQMVESKIQLSFMSMKKFMTS